MQNHLPRTLLSLALAAPIALPAAAQNLLEEVIVTAQKREQTATGRAAIHHRLQRRLSRQRGHRGFLSACLLSFPGWWCRNKAPTIRPS